MARLNRIDEAFCSGEVGIRSTCLYRGLFFVLSGAGTMGSNHVSYIREQLANAGSTWKICSWHRVQRLMQVGRKNSTVGWGPYEECRKAGAIIATAHSHSYSRTHLMESFLTQAVASTSNVLQIENGKTFAFVSGLGGRSIRRQNDDLAAKDWWAAVYTATQRADYGALFCTFNERGVADRAHCYFKDVRGRIADEFDVRAPPPVPEAGRSSP